MKAKAVLAALLAGLVLAGCGQAAKPAGPVATTRVEMVRSYRFDPPEIKVPAGATVTWQNNDVFTHSVTFSGALSANLVLSPGESGTVTFDQPGEYDYVCTFHTQQMKGKVIVTTH